MHTFEFPPVHFLARSDRPGTRRYMNTGEFEDVEARLREEREGLRREVERRKQRFRRTWDTYLCPCIVRFASRHPFLGYVLLFAFFLCILLAHDHIPEFLYWCLLIVAFTSLYACASGSTFGESLARAQAPFVERINRWDEVRDVLVDEQV